MSLKVWLPLDENLKNQGTMTVGITASGATINTSGKIGSCYQFNGTSSYLKFDKPLFDNSATEFSYACWFKPTDLTTSGCLFSNRSITDSTGFTIFVFNYNHILFDTGGRMVFDVPSTIVADQWCHLAFTWKKNGLKQIWINGSNVYSVTQSDVPTKATTTYCFIGASQMDATTPNTNYLKGCLNDVRIYDHALSTAEIKELAKGLLVHYKLDNINPNLLVDTNAPSLSAVYNAYGRYWEQVGQSGYTCTFEEIDDPPAPGIKYAVRETVTAVAGFHSQAFYSGAMVPVTIGTTYTISCYAKNISGGSNMALRFQIGDGQYTSGDAILATDDKWHQYHWTVTPNSTDSTASKTVVYAGGLRAVGEVLICGWKLEEGDTATQWVPNEIEPMYKVLYPEMLADSSGFGHHAVKHELISASSETPRYNSSTSVTSNGWAIPMKAVHSSDTKFSFNLWCKVSSTQTGSKIIALALNDNLVFNFGRSSLTTETSYQFFVFYSDYYIPISITMPFNEWHMWTGTHDGTTSKLYKDGVLVQSYATHTTYSIQDRSLQRFLGNPNLSDTYLISDLRIYTTALSEDDIKQLYETSASVDNYGNLHAYTIEESDAVSVCKNGSFKGEAFTETTSGAKIYKTGTVNGTSLIEI